MNQKAMIKATDFAGRLIRFGLERTPGSQEPQVRITVDREYIYVSEKDFKELTAWLFRTGNEAPKHAKEWTNG